jgi:type I restriction enzyme S subunit
MADWKEYILGETVDLITGFPFKGNKYEMNGALRVVRGENVTLGTLRWDSEKYWNHSVENLDKYFLITGDIVIGMDGSRVGQNRAIIRENELPLILAQRVARLRAKKQFDQKFIWYQIYNNRFLAYVEAIQTGTSIPHISPSQINDFELVAPDYKLQKTIANILSSLDDKIDLLNHQNKTIEALAEILFRQWFVEEAEDSWKKGEIRYFTKKIQYGYTQSASQENIGPKFLRITDIQGGNVNWDTIPFCPISDSDFLKYELKTGDIVVARTGASTGENMYIYKPERAVFASYLVRFQFPEPSVARYVAMHMRSSDYFQYIEGILSGSAQPNANANELSSFEITLPPKEKLHSFFKIVSKFDEKKHCNQTQIRLLTQLRDTLLPKLMSGEVRVEN